MGSRHYEITDDQKKEYASGVLLDLIVKQNYQYSVILDGADQDLEPLFVYMLAKGYLDVDEDNRYVQTPKGLEKLDNLHIRYEEYLAHFDLFSSVDLENGSFAFEKIFEMDDQTWESYINQENFVDLRIAVAWFKKMNPTDIVFLSFLKENQFDTDKLNWQFDLLSGLIWNQIEEILDTAIQIEELGYQTADGAVITGEQVIEDVIRQGAQLNVRLHAEEERMRHDDFEFPNDFSDRENETYVVTNYQNYFNPYYISPIWFLF